MAINLSLAQLNDASSPQTPINNSDFCNNPNLVKHAKVAACCDEIKGRLSSDKSLCPPPDACTLETCGRVCNRYYKLQYNCTVKPVHEGDHPGNGCEHNNDKKQKTKAPKHKKTPKHNGYPTGDNNLPVTTEQPKGGVASAKPPKNENPSNNNKYQTGNNDLPETTEQPEDSGYPEGPKDNQSTQQPGYPEEPINNKYATGPETTENPDIVN
uniref:WAP domain-containing protein n=1 Tax=Meloidogyne hapla TaxID=6305 RepID=A0A1I8BQ07_MELHA